MKVLQNDQLKHSSEKLQKTLEDGESTHAHGLAGLTLLKITILQGTICRFDAILVPFDLEFDFHPLTMGLCCYLPGRPCFMDKNGSCYLGF